jgi:DNA-binding transcriptional LysR family regulator
MKGEASNVPTRFGSFEVFTTYFLGPLMKFVDLEKLEVHELGPGHLEQAIADQRVDIGITYLPIPKAGVDFVEVTKIKMGVFGLASKFKSQNFSEIPFVIPLSPHEGTPSKVIGLDGWPYHKFQRENKFRVSMMESAMELCRKGHAVAYLPEFIVELHNANVKAECKLTEFESPVPKKDRSQGVFLVRHQRSSESSLERQIAKCLRSLT